jgi:hypothetical protein
MFRFKFYFGTKMEVPSACLSFLGFSIDTFSSSDQHINGFFQSNVFNFIFIETIRWVVRTDDFV